MKKKAAVLILFLVPFILISAEFLPVSKVREGMVLTGKTVLKGEKLSEFKVKVTGILKNMYPNKSFIIGEIEGDYYRETGVIAGMSGSPVYYNGKIVGAVSFSFPFTKRAIAGITPYEDMITTEKKTAPEVDIKIDLKDISNGKIIERLKKELKKRAVNFGFFKIPLKASGFSTDIVKKLNEEFSPFHFMAIPSSSGKIRIPEKIDTSSINLRDGDAINVHLMIGDFDLSAGGTVTHVKGDTFYAFGHPFFNLGKIEYPVSKAKIIGVVPSYESSFKLSSVENYIGKIVADRTSAIVGEIGSFPDLVSMKITMNYMKPEVFEIKMVRDKLLTPLLIYNALANVISSEIKAVGELSLRVDGIIYLRNGKSVVYNDIFSSNDTMGEFSLLYASLAYILMDNPVKEFNIDRLEINISPYEKKRVAVLKKVISEKYRVLPGENVNFSLYYKPLKEKLKVEKLSIPIPPFEKGSIIYIFIADAKSMQAFEAKKYQGGFKFPETESALLRALNNLRKNDIVYLKVFALRKSVFLNGYDYSGVPSSIFKLLLPSQKDYNYSFPNISIIKEYALPIDYKFEGKALIKLEIK